MLEHGAPKHQGASTWQETRIKVSLELSSIMNCQLARETQRKISVAEDENTSGKVITSVHFVNYIILSFAKFI